ncbi:LLM class flavin-dependent oxidoreductase [Methylobacillus gramineus]|uniref:LLM class flavin-dependent oxidoreductase n=1 Tax=Methylobacillus gramineus TaxID=755169 RepID=UPI001CFF610E|nr:LLM class flavin-dependent oxidoreductase [Methylobacillus gramineus]MCB5184388.1 LLM class flavin-dependent oxidoreductase [Methylobacillus gramineus]
MSIKFFWQIPTSGDGRYADAHKRIRGERSDSKPYFLPGVTDPRGRRFNYFDHLHQVAKAVELAKFDGLQVRNDPQGDESWIVAGYLSRATRDLIVLAEFDAARGSAVYAAKNAVSYQRFSGGRFAWQISTEADEAQRRRNGDYVAAEDLNTRIEEFVIVARHVITETDYDFKGRFFEVLKGGFQGPLSGQKVPPVYLSGNDEDAYALSARVADVHVLDAQPLADIRAQIERLHELASATGRPLEVGIRLDVLARETEEEAIYDAKRYAEQSGQSKGVAGGALWRGLTKDSTGASAVLVGSYQQVSEGLAAYAAVGVHHFILGAVPSLEEAYRIGENVLPQVRSLVAGTSQRAA